jgi:exonuclease SbcD
LLASSGYHVSGEVQPGAGVRIVTLRGSDCEVQCALMPFMGAGTARVLYGDPSIASQHDVHRAMVDDALARMRSDIPRIAVAHCFARGGEVSDSERVLSVGGLDTVGVSLFEPFAYTALGHLHKAQSFAGGTVRYSGSPLKYSVSEASHAKSVTLVEINSAGVHCQEIPIVPLRNLRVAEGEIADGVFRVYGDIGPADDFVHVRLSNTLPVANALQRIRSTYPMALSLEWVSRAATGAAGASDPAIERSQQAVNRLRSMHPLDVFSEFYASLTGEQPTPEQRALLDEAMERSRKEEQR